MSDIQHKHDVGADVEVRNMSPGGKVWNRAIVRAHEPYLGRPGYYVAYPDATEQWECHGGWVPETQTRAIPTVPVCRHCREVLGEPHGKACCVVQADPSDRIVSAQWCEVSS